VLRRSLSERSKRATPLSCLLEQHLFHQFSHTIIVDWTQVHAPQCHIFAQGIDNLPPLLQAKFHMCNIQQSQFSQRSQDFAKKTNHLFKTTLPSAFVRMAYALQLVAADVQIEQPI
jgi:hypothetical protein